jgi:hypothetical protein
VGATHLAAPKSHLNMVPNELYDEGYAERIASAYSWYICKAAALYGAGLLT